MTKYLDIDTKAMRAKILDLAIRGKLTEQRQEDGNARDLLKEIQEEKERLIKEKKIKKEKPLPEITEEEKPFEIPENWEWVRLGNISNYGGTKTKVSSVDIDDSTWVLDMEDIEKESGKILSYKIGIHRSIKGERIVFSQNDILYSKLRPYLQKILIAPKDGVCTTELVPFSCYGDVYHKYIVTVLKSSYVTGIVNAKAHGVKMPRVGTDAMKELLIPLPPLAEQKRIADKVSALFAQLDAIDKTYEEYRELQQAMKAKLLDLAIQGKLTDQRKEDGDARDLLKEIQAEKEKLIKEKKIKKEKPLPEIEADEIPFEIPTNWMWVRLGEIVSVFGGKRIPKGTKLQDTPTKYRYIRVADMEYNTVNIPSVKYISEEIYKKIKRYTISDQDVYITVAGTIGKVGTIPHELNNANLTENANKLVPYNLNKEFLCNILKSPFGKAQIEKNITRVSQPKLAIKRIEKFVIPLPPLAEQKRIVAKLDKLLPHLNPGKE
jgi:type I restriction enzyme S subunit